MKRIITTFFTWAKKLCGNVKGIQLSLKKNLKNVITYWLIGIKNMESCYMSYKIRWTTLRIYHLQICWHYHVYLQKQPKARNLEWIIHNPMWCHLMNTLKSCDKRPWRGKQQTKLRATNKKKKKFSKGAQYLDYDWVHNSKGPWKVI